MWLTVIRVSSKGQDVSAEGAVAGFMHFADLQPKNDAAGKLVCYADACDALIDQGWAVAETCFVMWLKRRCHQPDAKQGVGSSRSR